MYALFRKCPVLLADQILCLPRHLTYCGAALPEGGGTGRSELIVTEGGFDRMQVSDAVSVNNTADLGEYWQRLVVFFSVRGCATAADDLASEGITRILGSLR